MASVRAHATTSRAISPRSRAIRATELPISPMPISVSRSKSGLPIRSRHEIAQSADHLLHFVRRPDGDAQAVRQRIPADLAHDNAAGAQRLIGRIGAVLVPKSASTKLPSLGQTLIPASSSPRVSTARYSRLCVRPFSTQPGSDSAAIAAAWAASETLNGARTRFSTSMIAGGA